MMFLFVELRELPTNTLGEIVEKTFGAVLKWERQKRGWAVHNLLSHSGIYVSAPYICAVESGRTIPSIIVMMKFARVYQLDPDELFQLYKTAYLKKVMAKLEKKYARARINLGLSSVKSA